jgi:prepilin-type N-terminal cleavage/methylation domain-containing protein
MSRPHACRDGFTVIELIIAMTLVGLVLTKLTLVMEQARRAHEDESVSMALGDQANELLDKIAYALVGSSREKLLPGSSAPFFGASLTYQISLGVEDGDVVWSDPEMIAFDEQGLEIFWAQNAGEANERKVVWANTVSQMFEDELLNGDDDNGNGLADELGLSFVLDGDSVTIRLTLERAREDGGRIQETRSTTVTCRN